MALPENDRRGRRFWVVIASPSGAQVVTLKAAEVVYHRDPLPERPVARMRPCGVGHEFRVERDMIAIHQLPDLLPAIRPLIHRVLVPLMRQRDHRLRDPGPKIGIISDAPVPCDT